MKGLTTIRGPGKQSDRAAGGPRLGAHMSAAGGLENAFFAGVAVGCDCLQLFVKNQRQWQAPPLTDDQIRRFQVAQQESGLWPVVAHASYLLNLASPDSTNRKKSIAAMIDELNRCEKLAIDGLIFHPGAHMDETMIAGIKRVATSLDRVHKDCLGYRCRILLETTAGQGTAIGYRFEQIADILVRTREPERLGVCLDTCHLFAAGYDFRKPAGYAAMIDELESAIGLTNVRCIHLNDSKRELGSRVDRHDHIGKGKIGKAGFAHFMNDRRWHDVPMILETPHGTDGRGTDLNRVNLKRLRSLIQRGISEHSLAKG